MGLFQDIEQGIAHPGEEADFNGSYITHRDYNTSRLLNHSSPTAPIASSRGRPRRLLAAADRPPVMASIPGIVLAAGASVRMVDSKAFLAMTPGGPSSAALGRWSDAGVGPLVVVAREPFTPREA